MVNYFQYCRISAYTLLHILVSGLLHFAMVWASIRQPLNAESRLSHFKFNESVVMHVKLICVTFACRQLHLPTPCVAVGGSFYCTTPRRREWKTKFPLFPAYWDAHSGRDLRVCHAVAVSSEETVM